jgi:hypothetical protein
VTNPSRVVIGNAADCGAGLRGWFVGQFLRPEHGPRATDAVEVKWGTHTDGETRATWASSAAATSLSILVQGQIRLYFDDGQEALLNKPGDFALWAPRVAHRWRSEAPDTVVLTVRWPSIAGDATDLG